MIYHHRGTCNDPVVELLDAYASDDAAAAVELDGDDLFWYDRKDRNHPRPQLDDGDEVTNGEMD